VYILHQMKRLYLVVFAAIVVIGCQTAPTEIPEDLTQAELIQLAQEASDQDNFSAALAYYRSVEERFPEDRVAVVTARYEIAFIHYKQEDLQEAEAGFEQVLGMYDFDAATLPQWPRVLAEKLLAEIRESAAENDATAAE